MRDITFSSKTPAPLSYSSEAEAENAEDGKFVNQSVFRAAVNGHINALILYCMITAAQI